MSLEESARALAGLQRFKREAEVHLPGRARPPRPRRACCPGCGRALLGHACSCAAASPRRRPPPRPSKYAAMQDRDEKYVYHGRVVRQGGWTICQYWFFFAYNNWRSGFHGVNDHESDWELVSVYLYERRRAARARMGRLRLARLPRRRPAAPLGRPGPSSSSRASPCRLRRRRVARLVLQGRRVPGGGAASRSRARARTRSRRCSGSGGEPWARGAAEPTPSARRSSTSRAATGRAWAPGRRRSGRRT